MGADPKREERASRRVEPVAEEAAVLAPPEDARGRRGLAAWLALGPLLAAAGLIGWLRLVSGLRPGSLPAFSPAALGSDLLLALQFALGHSLLARGAGRRLLNRPFGPAAERPLYVLVTGMSLCLLVLAWRPSGPLLWEWPGGWRVLAWILQATGLGVAVWGSLVVGGGMLLGLPHLRAVESGAPEPQHEFTALPPYSLLRQPINAGFLLMLLAIPAMSADLLVMALVFGGWILLAAPFEERDLAVEYEGYAAYLARTPRWIPRLRGRDR